MLWQYFVGGHNGFADPEQVGSGRVPEGLASRAAGAVCVARMVYESGRTGVKVVVKVAAVSRPVFSM